MRNKFGAKKTTVNGIVFDSQAEATYYKKLIEDQKAGKIKGFTLQPWFLLQPKFTKNGQTFQPIHYVADFKVKHLDGSVSIIDVKGFETAMFKMKRKMFEECYRGLTLEVVKVDAPARRPSKPKTAEDKARAKRQKERKARSKERRNANIQHDL